MERIKLDQLAAKLREGNIILARLKTGWSILIDALNEGAISKAKSLHSLVDFGYRHVLFQTDAELNRLVDEIPAIGWDLLDSSNGEVILLLSSGRGVHDLMKKQDGALAVRKVDNREEQALFRSAQTTLAAIPLKGKNHQFETKVEEYSGVLKEVDYLLNLTPIQQVRHSIIRLDLNGEVKILKS
ncbi:MAG: Sua5/YciO/YrdC/YwlC family protein [Bacteroidota bacterium]